MSTKATRLFDHLPAPRTVFTYTRKRHAPVALEDDSDDEQPNIPPSIPGTATQEDSPVDLMNSTIETNHGEFEPDSDVLIDPVLQGSQTFETDTLWPLIHETPIDSLLCEKRVSDETDIDMRGKTDNIMLSASSDIIQDKSAGQDNSNNNSDAPISGTVSPLDIFAFPDEALPRPSSPFDRPLPTHPSPDRETSILSPTVDPLPTSDIFDFPDNDSSSESDGESNLNTGAPARQTQPALKPCITLPRRPRLKKSVTFSEQTIVATFKRGACSSDYSASFFEPMMAPHRSYDVVLDESQNTTAISEHVSPSIPTTCSSSLPSFARPAAPIDAPRNARPKRSLVSRLKSARGEDVSEGPSRCYNFEEEEVEEDDEPESLMTSQAEPRTYSSTQSALHRVAPALMMEDVPQLEQDENQLDGNEQCTELAKRRKVYRPENPMRVQVTYKRERHSTAGDDELAQLDNLLLSLKRTNSA